MRRKPTAHVSKVYRLPPTATAANWWACGRWPITALSTSATSGTERLQRIIGAASAHTRLWVGVCCQASRTAFIKCALKLDWRRLQRNARARVTGGVLNTDRLACAAEQFCACPLVVYRRLVYSVRPLPLPLLEPAMPKNGLLLALVLSLLSACDPSTPGPAEVTATQTTPVSSEAAKPAVDRKALAERYAGRELTVVDVSEVQLDGASTLSISFSVPLDPEQKLAERLHLVDSKDGKVDGAWELTDNLMEVRLRHLEPQRKLVLTVDAGLLGLNGKSLATEQVTRLETRDLQASVGFASRGSLLPTRLAEGLPAFLNRWGRASNLDNWEARSLLPMADLVYGGRFDLNPARNTRETLLLPISGLEPFKQPGVYLAVMREAGSYNYAQPATLFTLSDIGLSARRYQNRIDVFTQALAGGDALGDVSLEILDAEGQVLAEGKTDGAGHGELPLPPKAEVLLANQGEQTSLLRLNTAALDLAEFDIAGPVAHPLQFFVFGPRDLYRPGETVLL